MVDSITPRLGLGIGWRPELALAISRRRDLGFVELLAEDFDPGEPLPTTVLELQERGVVLVPHGVSLSLGSAEPPDRGRLERLARLAERCRAPLVSEHLAFVRGGGRETGHLLPVPRTRETLEIVVANIRMAKEFLPVPLAIENIATLVEWPDAQMDEADFLSELLERADVGLLLDVENLYANAHNHGYDPVALLERLPLGRLAYVHLAGGVEREGRYHDTHAHPLNPAVLELFAKLCALAEVPGAMLERDDGFPSDDELHRELDAIGAILERDRRHAASVQRRTAVPEEQADVAAP